MVFWYHVTPLFLVPSVIAAGGFRCGRDLAAAGSPRRSSSRQDDDQLVPALGDRRTPSGFVMLFRKRASPLLDEKLRGTRTPGATWRVYPHVRFAASAERCLAAAGGQVFGSPDNVGRTLNKGRQPRVTVYDSTDRLKGDKVKEILLDMGHRTDRSLPLTVVEYVAAFSAADADLVEDHFGRVGSPLKVHVEPKDGYVGGQGRDPGAGFLAKTRLYYEAIWSGDADRQQQLRLELQKSCFD